MAAVCFSETLVTTSKSTRRCNSEGKYQNSQNHVTPPRIYFGYQTYKIPPVTVNVTMMIMTRLICAECEVEDKMVVSPVSRWE